MTDPTLREFFDSKIDTLERHLQARMLDLERRLTDKIVAASEASAVANEVAKAAVDKAEAAVEKRLEGLNELRGLVSDYQRNLLPRTEANVRFDSIEEKVQKLEDKNITEAGHTSGLAAGWAYVIAVLGIAGVIAGILIALFG